VTVYARNRVSTMATRASNSWSCHLLVAENRQPPSRPLKSMEPFTCSSGSDVFYQELFEEETCQANHGEAASVHLNIVRTLEVTSSKT